MYRISKDFILKGGNFEIYNTSAQLVKQGILTDNECINIVDLGSGSYIFKTGNVSLQFVVTELKSNIVWITDYFRLCGLCGMFRSF